MFSDLNVRTPAYINSLRINAIINSSKCIPLYLKKPAAAKGNAQTIHNHETISFPTISLSPKYTPTAAPTAATEHIN